MNSREFVQVFNEYPIFQELERELVSGKKRAAVHNCIGSAKSLLFAHLQKHTQRSVATSGTVVLAIIFSTGPCYDINRRFEGKVFCYFFLDIDYSKIEHK